MAIPKYLTQPASVRGQKSERKFGKLNPGLRKHARSGAGTWNKDDFSVSGKCRIETKLVCRGTQQHTINLAKLAKLAARAERAGEIPMYVITIDGGDCWVLLPKKYLHGVTNRHRA